jgi:hypothetical protein
VTYQKLLPSGDEHSGCKSESARTESLHQMVSWQSEHHLNLWYNCVAQESADALERKEGGLERSGLWVRRKGSREVKVEVDLGKAPPAAEIGKLCPRACHSGTKHKCYWTS